MTWEAAAAPITENLLQQPENPRETGEKQVFAEATLEGSCLQNTEVEEEEERGKAEERRLRGSWGGRLGGLTSFKDSWGSSAVVMVVVVVVDTVGPAP